MADFLYSAKDWNELPVLTRLTIGSSAMAAALEDVLMSLTAVYCITGW